MELSAVQRRLVFAVIVFLLAGLGVYLLDSAGSGRSQAIQAPPRSRPDHPGRPRSTGPGSPQRTSSSASPPAPSPSASAFGAPDIYQWLPFTQAGLASAASAATRFGDAYGTFSYTEKTSAYIASMSTLMSSDLAGQIAAAYSAPGVASLRVKYRQVSTGSAAVTSIRAFGPTSITFIVGVTERVTATRNGGTSTTSYAITVTGGDASWQVSDIELQSAGNT